MGTHHIGNVLKQALATFTCKKDAFLQNIEALKVLLDKTTASDVDLKPHLFSGDTWKSEEKAPVSYIDIYEDDIITMGIFILKPGMKLPLHDHPYMYGLIKVLAGTLKISSFTVRTDLDSFGDKDKLYPPVMTIEKHPEIIADNTSKSCTLEPFKRNLHEIESLGEPSAFLDVLSPPYETYIPNIGPRKCTYFKIISQLNPILYKVVEAPQPSWFWSDLIPYTGPELFEDEISE